MIIRRAAPRLQIHQLKGIRGSLRSHGRVQYRFSTSSSAPSADLSTSHSLAAPLASITSELDKISPRFDVSADCIEIIRSPTEFYETLKAKISNAQRRVYLSTLYVGKSEEELVSASLISQ